MALTWAEANVPDALPYNGIHLSVHVSPSSPRLMADHTSKKDPLHLREERPDYVKDLAGQGNVDGEDLSETVPPAVNAGPQDPGSLGVEKPHVHLDEAAVRKAEAEGKGYDAPDPSRPEERPAPE